jgi:hypothetical protein
MSVASTPATARLVPGEITLWCRDLISCLQATVATVLAHHGQDPLGTLGAAWEFLYKPGDVTAEEFYFPCRQPDLARSLCPHHPVRSAWRRPADGERPLAELERAVAAGRLPIAAVDNYHLPFRPAFHDVHAAHLVVVYGIDLQRGEVHLSDAMPPAFQGPIPVADFERSWGSLNPDDHQDAFFSGARIGCRWLLVELEGRFPPMDAAWLRRVLAANLAGFVAAPRGGDPTGWAGLAGLRVFSDQLVGRARAGEARALEELYVLGWGLQAQASLHGELLRTRGGEWDLPALREAGRAVEAVAHAWTGLRITGAHGRGDPAGRAADLRRHGERLRRRHEEALEAVAMAVEAL